VKNNDLVNDDELDISIYLDFKNIFEEKKVEEINDNFEIDSGYSSEKDNERDESKINKINISLDKEDDDKDEWEIALLKKNMGLVEEKDKLKQKIEHQNYQLYDFEQKNQDLMEEIEEHQKKMRQLKDENVQLMLKSPDDTVNKIQYHDDTIFEFSDQASQQRSEHQKKTDEYGNLLQKESAKGWELVELKDAELQRLKDDNEQLKAILEEYEKRDKQDSRDQSFNSSYTCFGSYLNENKSESELSHYRFLGEKKERESEDKKSHEYDVKKRKPISKNKSIFFRKKGVSNIETIYPITTDPDASDYDIFMSCQRNAKAFLLEEKIGNPEQIALSFAKQIIRNPNESAEDFFVESLYKEKYDRAVEVDQYKSIIKKAKPKIGISCMCGRQKSTKKPRVTIGMFLVAMFLSERDYAISQDCIDAIKNNSLNLENLPLHHFIRNQLSQSYINKM
jgi:hypothetical protein